MSSVAVLYWSGSGNTEAIARAVAQGARAEVCKHIADASLDDIKSASVVAIGCPALGDEWIDETQVAPFIDSAREVLAEKRVALFGSYGWGNGEWLKKWRDSLVGSGLDVLEDALAIREAPDASSTAECTAFGERIASE